MALNQNFQYSSYLNLGTSQDYNWMYYYSYDYSNNWWGSFEYTDYDYYQIWLDSGKYSVATSRSYTDSYLTPYYDLDTSIVVYDSDGNEVGSGDIAGFSSASFKVSTAGQYYIRVKNDGSASYDYGYYNIVVNSTNSAPELTGSQATLSSAVIASGGTSAKVTIKTSDLLKGFSDADNDTLSVTNVSTDFGTLKAVTGGYELSVTGEGKATISYYVYDGNTSVFAQNYVTALKSADPKIVESILTDKSTEDGGEAQLKVYLAAAPTATVSADAYVTLTYKVSDTSEAKFVNADGSLTETITVKLTASNWSDGVVLKIRGMQDYDDDGDTTFSVTRTSTKAGGAVSSNYYEIARKNETKSYSFVNNGDRDNLGRDRDEALYLVGDDGKPAKDNLTGNDGADRLYGGYMIDLLDGGNGKDRLYGGYEDDALYGKQGDDQLYGEADDDYLYGGEGNDRLDGGSGSDEMSGGAGNDVYYVSLSDEGQVEDLIIENANDGTDTVYVPFQVESYTLPENVEVLRMNAGFGDTAVTGNKANNQIVANAGDNEIDGGAGNDTLNGGKGQDTLTGGSGSDTFDFDSVKDSTSATSADIIMDLGAGDKIDLSTIDAKTSTTTNDKFTFSTVQSTTFASGTEGQVRFVGSYLYINNDTDTSADMVIEVVGVKITLANATTYLTM